MWRAILIDDEEIALDVLEIKLNEIGGVSVVGKYQWIADALRHCGTLRPDLIFLDIEMPGMNGLEAAEMLRARCPDAEVIYVTAYHEYAVDAFATEAIGYLLKPVAKDKLLRALSRFEKLQAKKQDKSVHTGSNGSSELKSDGTDQPVLSLKVLGSMELYTADGRLLTWRTRKTKELFALLWHHRGQPVYKYTILEHLWPDDSAERGQRLLHTSLYYLRSLFKSEGYGEVVRYGDDRYWLDPVAIRSDLEELLQRITSGLRGEAGQRAVSLYGGDYLETDHYPWANAYRIELRSTMMAALLTVLGEAEGEHRILLLRKLIALEPGREEYYDLLADAQERSGDRAGARETQVMKERMLLEEI
ncbi:response regulator [Paenibacillus guangzhouensis]|uniref:response regulator n=1 Tax=Paenibacillus guangzhouensis TaxID=1473112 RepID=UPI00126740B1|nr:response regulator [Paenibacillus guangzhouensis]